jgi:hypothetical protein
VGDGGVFHTPCADFSRPVEELEYTCLLKSTFTEASHVRGLDEVDFFDESLSKKNELPQKIKDLK